MIGIIVIVVAFIGGGIGRYHYGATIKLIPNYTENYNQPIATICFQFDDGCEEDEIIVQEFDKYDLKCGFALLSEMDTQKTDKYLSWQKQGYEILAHSTDGYPMQDDTYKKYVIRHKMKKSKRILISKGFDIQGWVTPSSQLKEEFKSLVPSYYEYAYTNYYGPYKQDKRPYNLLEDGEYELYRMDLYGSVDTNIKAIEQTIENNGLITFYFHSRDLNQELRESIDNTLSYVRDAVNDGRCVCLPPNSAYNYYFNPQR